MCELDAGGHIDTHVLSFEKSFFVIEGNPVLILDGQGYRLEPGACGLIQVGTPHSWLGPKDGMARWTDMNAHCPKGENGSENTYFLGPPAKAKINDLDIRDPINRHIFRMSDDDIKVENLRMGLKTDAPKVSASMATALLVYSGIALKMLVDERLGAALHKSFMVEYVPGGNALPHDHPLEEAYIIVDGEVEAWADGEKYLMREGDFLWTGVGCVHAFFNKSDTTVRWLETQSPLPPARHSYRFVRDWDYLKDQINSSEER